MMKHALLTVILCSAVAAPLAADVNGFAIVNQSGGALSGLAIRRVGGDQWTPLGVSPASGASARADFTNPDCAFDLRATVAGRGQVLWHGVNLCDAKRVILIRDASGRAWVDYD